MSYRHFVELIASLAGVDTTERRAARHCDPADRASASGFCSPGRAKRKTLNPPIALASSRCYMRGSIVKLYAGKETKTTRAVETAFFAIFSAYRQICSEFQARMFSRMRTSPMLFRARFIARAVSTSTSSCSTYSGGWEQTGIWAYWGALRCSDEEKELRHASLNEVQCTPRRSGS